ncbi:MAG TPA: hypothetical protein VFG50_13400 [Rhodothermales bacterium]|nr:hypothetical protein [Rhodothermales bacterium]
MSDHAKPGVIGAWIAIAVAIAANAAGYLFNLWDTPIWFDEVVHGYTLFALTFLLAVTLYRFLSEQPGHGLLIVLAIVALGLAIGALWEVYEWGRDQMTGRNTILGKYDTIIDLVMDTLGSLIAALLSRYVARKEAHAES